MIPFDEALAALKKCDCPEDKIIQSSAYWIPLQWVYVRLVESGDLIRWCELEKDKRRVQWNMVRNEDWPEWKKICVCQALYVYSHPELLISVLNAEVSDTGNDE